MATSHERNHEIFFGPRSRRYNWVDWFDGQLWELKQGEDFQVTPRSFAAQAHRATREFGNLRIRTRVIGDTVWIQTIQAGDPL